jgi:hypothetical protein
MKDVATKDFIRGELRALLEELDASDKRAKPTKRRKTSTKSVPNPTRTSAP